MGPHSSECGNGLPIHDGVEEQAAASMGPHSSECGNADLHLAPVPAQSASMGPHSSECGNVSERTMPWAKEPSVLQWGRTRLSAETAWGL